MATANHTKPDQRPASAKRIAWREARELALEGIAEASCFIVARRLWLMSIACMRDTTGSQIEFQLAATRDEFRIAVTDLALREHWTGYGRTWESWRARRLATLALFLAHLSRPATYHGAPVWMVRGIPKGALMVACAMRTAIAGLGVKVEPSPNTVYSDLCELVAAGIIHPPAQFAWWKVPKWARGRSQASGQCWAFMHYFIRVQPFDGAAPTKIFRAPEGRIMHARKPDRKAPDAGVDAPSAVELDRLDAELARLGRQHSTDATPAAIDAEEAAAIRIAQAEAMAIIAAVTSRGPPGRA